MRLLGIKIQGGYTSEARVFASIIGHRESSYDASVLYYVWPNGLEAANAFEKDARTTLTRIDTKLRMGSSGRLLAAQKMISIVQFRAVLPRLIKQARECQPDLIYSSQQPWDCAAATYLAKQLRKPQIIHLHYSVGPWLRTGFSSHPRAFALLSTMLGLSNPLERLKTCDHVVAISDYIRNEAIRHGVAPNRVTTIHNTVTPSPTADSKQREAIRAELGIASSAPVIGIVGRLDPDKGHDDTVKAFFSIASAHPDAHLVIVGDGPRFAAIQGAVAQAGLDQRVLLTGWRSDVPRLLTAMDIFAHPSRREPFGLAVVEAMAHGLPVVAYADGATPEIVQHGITGLLAPPGDIDTLAYHLSSLLDKPDIGRRMGKQGKGRVETQFRPEDASRAFAGLLQRVVHKSS